IYIYHKNSKAYPLNLSEAATSASGTKQTLKTTASDAALAAWRRQMKLHVSVESNGAESPA
ncbi:hypothetical protein, partial [Klebsiella variicola]|uniref:hypothetical protein n=1 Tax=Klebsiella variicola TaxID=244366 RepID=UPI0009E4BF55